MSAGARPTMHHFIAVGRAARRGGDGPGALCAFQEAMLLDRRGELAFVEYGEELRRQGLEIEAEDTARQVLARHPGSVPALMLLGRCLRRADATAAMAAFGQAVALAPDTPGSDPAPFTELAHAQRKAGQLEAASDNYRRAMALAPDRVFPYRGLALCARAAGDANAALDWHRQAASRAPQDRSLAVEVAHDLRALEQLDEARSAYDALLAADAADYPALMGRAALARRQNDAAAAALLYERASAARPGELAPVLATIGLHRDLGELAAAEALVQDLLRRQPDLAAAWVQTGWIERSRANHAASLAAFSRAHELEPGIVDTVVQMAVASRAVGDQKRSEALFAEAMRLDPSHGGALVQSGLQALAGNQNDVALELFRGARGSLMLEVQACLGACEALARLGRVDDAMALLAETERRAGSNPSLTARRIALLRETGALPEALAAAVAAMPGAASHFGLFMDVMRVLLLVGDAAQIGACLDAARPVTERDRIQYATMRGFAAEEAGDLPEARRRFEQAAAIREQDSAVYLDVTRVNLLDLDPDAAFESMRRNRNLAATEIRLLGYSANVSQTHYGQMIDEYRLDRPLLHAIRGLQALEPEARAAPLIALAGTHPDSTLAAIAAIDALWRGGRLTRPLPLSLTSSAADTPVATGEPLIPRHVFQFWDAAPPPDDVLRLMHGWQRHNPDHRYTRMADKEAQLFLWRSYGIAAVQAYHRARQPAHKADLVRLAVLLEFGGIYADADDRCFAPLGRIVADTDTLVLHREDLGTLGNNFIAVTPNHPMIRRALDAALDATNRGDNDLLWFATGPGLITRAFVAELAAEGRDQAAMLATVRILSRRDLHRSVAAHCRTAYKKTERHWENTAFSRPAPTAQASNT